MPQAKKAFTIMAAGLGLALAGIVHPVRASPLTVTSSTTGPIAGAVYDNLNPGTAGPAVTFSGNANYVVGASAYNYAPPVLTNGDGTNFGDANGSDTSRYIAIDGGGSAVFHFNSLEAYFGLLWGSADSFNKLSFYNDSTLIDSITGSSVTTSATGDRTASGTYYVNISSSLPFNTIVASSTSNAFEFDNVAYVTSATPVPEPASLAMFATGLGLLGIVMRYRRRTNS